MSNKFEMNDYVDVAARIAEFRTKHPEGSLQPADLGRPYTVQDLGGQMFIVVVTAAYRTPDDPRPGVGMAYEQFPGKTPYTRGSELQNAETSSWGRAIVAALIADTKKGISSAEEVRNRSADRDADQESPEDQVRIQIRNRCTAVEKDPKDAAKQFEELYGENIRTASLANLEAYLAVLGLGNVESVA